MGTATAPSQELGVGGIPTVVRFGGIQLVVGTLCYFQARSWSDSPGEQACTPGSDRSFPAFSCTPIQSSIQPLCRSHYLPLLDCALSCVTEERGETGDQLFMKDPNLNTREVVPHSTCVAQTVRL